MPFTNIVSVPSVSASLIQLVVILILNKIYGIVAVVLVHMELPRTDTEFANNFTTKICVLKFVNFYAGIVYVAFIKSRRDAWPGSYNTVAGRRVDQCDPCGCIIELCIQVSPMSAICVHRCIKQQRFMFIQVSLVVSWILFQLSKMYIFI